MSRGLATSQTPRRHTNSALVVRAERVTVRGYPELDPAIRDAVDNVLRELGVAPAISDSSLVVPRRVHTGGQEHDMAELLGRCLRPGKRKQVALCRVQAGALARRYPERLDAGDICRRGEAFAQVIEARRDALLGVLLAYETALVARDETARTLDLLRGLNENRAYFQRRVGDIATFLPCNQPLYALACFGLVPALMASRVHVRPPRVMGSFFDQLIELLEVPVHFSNLSISRLDRAAFIAERSAARIDEDGQRVPITDAVIFTGSHGNAQKVRKQFQRDVLFIVNGAGHNPLVITESAELSRAVASAVRVQLYNQGQDCASPSAILVHRSRQAELIARLREALGAVKVGPYADPEVMVGPLTRRDHLERVQRVLIENARWLDDQACGVIRTGPGIVEPTIICKPLAEGGNFREHYAPIFFVQAYDSDAELARYFEDARYPLHAMYVTLFGHSPYVDSLVDRPLAGRVLHDSSTIIRDTDLHAPGVERGTQPYGGYGFGASSISIAGLSVAAPTLPQRDLFERLVLPGLRAGSPGTARLPDSPPVSVERPEPAPTLGELEARFLDPAIAPVYRDTAVEPLIDGARYLGAVRDAICRAQGPGDAIFLLAYQIDPSWSITGEPDGVPLGQLLAARAARGVQVRVVLNGTPAPLNPWRENRAAARMLRGWRVGTRGAPLADCVLVDSSGASFSGSHHQKLVLVRHGSEVTAFVSGMDLVPDHWDQAPHAGSAGDKRWPDGSPWGWHDVGVRVRGAAVRGIWDNFCARWRQAKRSRRAAPAPGPCPKMTPVISGQSVQVLRSAFGWQSGPVRELYLAIKRAIGAARKYIYIEDQFLCDHGAELFGVAFPAALVPIPPEYSLFGALAERLEACPELELVCVSSGKSDPIDFAPGPRNRRLTPSLRRMMAQLSPAARSRVAVWRVEDVTVHSKLILIDDELAAIGSGNFRTRSFFGLDDELHVAFTAADGSVARLRQALWHEHLEVAPEELGDLDRALGYWRTRGVQAPAARRRRLVPIKR